VVHPCYQQQHRRQCSDAPAPPASHAGHRHWRSTAIHHARCAAGVLIRWRPHAPPPPTYEQELRCPAQQKVPGHSAVPPPHLTPSSHSRQLQAMHCAAGHVTGARSSCSVMQHTLQAEALHRNPCLAPSPTARVKPQSNASPQETHQPGCTSSCSRGMRAAASSKPAVSHSRRPPARATHVYSPTPHMSAMISAGCCSGARLGWAAMCWSWYAYVAVVSR
jgi:hypothetical protein